MALVMLVGVLIAATTVELYRLASCAKYVFVQATPRRGFLTGLFAVAGTAIALVALIVLLRSGIHQSKGKLGPVLAGQEKS